jgi:hypothetical protein
VLFLVFFSHKPLPNQTRRDKQIDYLCSLVSFFGSMLTGFLIAAMAFVLFFGGILTGQGIEYYGIYFDAFFLTLAPSHGKAKRLATCPVWRLSSSGFLKFGRRSKRMYSFSSR